MKLNLDFIFLTLTVYNINIEPIILIDNDLLKGKNTHHVLEAKRLCRGFASKNTFLSLSLYVPHDGLRKGLNNRPHYIVDTYFLIYGNNAIVIMISTDK